MFYNNCPAKLFACFILHIKKVSLYFFKYDLIQPTLIAEVALQYQTNIYSMTSNAANGTYTLSCVHGGKMVVETKPVQTLTMEEELLEKIMDMNAREKFIYASPNGDVCWAQIHEEVKERIKTTKASLNGAKVLTLLCVIIATVLTCIKLAKGDTPLDIYNLGLFITLIGINIVIAHFQAQRLKQFKKQDVLLGLFRKGVHQ